MIWDSHTHWGNYWEDTYADDPSAWIETCEKKGVTHTIVLPGRSLMDATAVSRGNNVLNSLAGKSGGRIIAFCIVNLWSRDEALGELERCAAMPHIRGIKLHPWLQGTSILSPVTEAVCDFAGEHDLPILFHDGTPCFGIPSQIGILARRHPRRRSFSATPACSNIGVRQSTRWSTRRMCGGAFAARSFRGFAGWLLRPTAGVFSGDRTTDSDRRRATASATG